MYKKSIFKLRNVLAVTAMIAFTFVACNNEGEKTEPAADTPVVTPAPAPVTDTVKKDSPVIDTANVKPVVPKN